MSGQVSKIRKRRHGCTISFTTAAARLITLIPGCEVRSAGKEYNKLNVAEVNTIAKDERPLGTTVIEANGEVVVPRKEPKKQVATVVRIYLQNFEDRLKPECLYLALKSEVTQGRTNYRWPPINRKVERPGPNAGRHLSNDIKFGNITVQFEIMPDYEPPVERQLSQLAHNFLSPLI